MSKLEESKSVPEPELLKFLPEFMEEFREQLISDNKAWGNTWKFRPMEGQEERVKSRYDDYFEGFFQAGVPVPWLKVIGNAYIAWVREKGYVKYE